MSAIARAWAERVFAFAICTACCAAESCCSAANKSLFATRAAASTASNWNLETSSVVSRGV